MFLAGITDVILWKFMDFFCNVSHP
jgi:hypothetical protein